MLSSSAPMRGLTVLPALVLGSGTSDIPNPKLLPVSQYASDL
ncbi:hypothetical protein ABWH92_08635 [Ahrensia marina]